MDKHQLADIAKQYGTPCFVFDTDLLAERMKKAAVICGETVRLCYSIKANPFLTAAMQPLVKTLEVCSPGELEICMDQGIDPNMILFSGVTKTANDVARAMDVGVRHFTCESPLHVRLIDEAARARNLVVPVLLRLTAGSQFGMDERDFFAALDNCEHTPGIDIQGVHYFSGTQRKNLDRSQRKELTMLAELVQKLKTAYGMETVRVEYGPGLYFPYFAHEDDSDTLSPLRELAPDLQKLAKSCELTIEMGRFFAAECGAYLTRMVDTKQNCGTNYAIIDGGIHHVNYIGANMGMRVPRIDVLSNDTPSNPEEPSVDYCLCGSLCTTADVLVRQVPLPKLTVGDTLAFRYIGAYSVTEGPALFLSRTMPCILLAGGGKVQIARGYLDSWRLNVVQQW